jgi:N utilization substance protein A
MQQSVNLNLILDQVAKDKGIERSTLVAILEESIQTAAKKHFGMERNLKAHFDEDKGQVDLFQVLTIVEDATPEIPIPDPVNMVPVSVAHEKGIEVEVGDELDFPIYYRPDDEVEARAQDEQWGDLLHLKTYRRSFGRIAAQTAKQVMIQGTRNAERENVFNEYKDRKGEVITGIVRRFERGNLIVDLGRAEAVLPVREQVPRESYRAGDRIQAYVVDVLRESKGRRSSSRAPAPSSCASSSRWRSRRSPRASSSSRRRPASRAAAPRSPSRPATRTSTRSAPASG